MSEGPSAVEAFWARTADGVRLRLGHWPAAPDTGPRGSILLFPGRTEYLEKYGRVAAELTASGYHVFGADWRGQGHSDRVTDDSRLGHVNEFADYQRDVAAVLKSAQARNLPRPWFLIAHSMGGCIGLRALVEGLPVERAVFSAPMWGIFVAPLLKPAAILLPGLARLFGRGLTVTPGTRPSNYVTDTDFAQNLLTTDRDHYDYLARQALADPAFALGGPTLHWLGAARREMQALGRAPRPTLPVKTYVGTREQVVDTVAIRAMHRNWSSAELVIVPDAKHELMMEAPEMRRTFLDGALAFFDEGRSDA